MTKRLRIFVTTLLVLLVSCQGQQQTEAPPVDPISPEITDYEVVFHHNAPARITRKVKQDRDGNLIMAAYDEIIRYDGTTFTNFTKANGLDTCFAFGVLEDSKGNIWIADDQIGAFRFDKETEEFTHFTTADGLGHRRNMSVYEDRAGNIWMGSQGGASRYDGKSWKNFILGNGPHDNDISTFMEDKKGRLWIGTRGHAYYYDPPAELKKDVNPFTKITDIEGKPFENIWSFVEDPHGNIWLSGPSIWRYDGKTFTRVSRTFTSNMYLDKKGNLWATSPLGIFMRFDAAELNKPFPQGKTIFQTHNQFLGISEDKEGNIWFGGGSGVWRYDGQAVTYFTGKPLDNKN